MHRIDIIKYMEESNFVNDVLLYIIPTRIYR